METTKGIKMGNTNETMTVINTAVNTALALGGCGGAVEEATAPAVAFAYQHPMKVLEELGIPTPCTPSEVIGLAVSAVYFQVCEAVEAAQPVYGPLELFEALEAEPGLCV